MKNKLPDRWNDYTAIGTVIPGTRFLPFKTPLKEEMCRRALPQTNWFTPAMLLEKAPGLKLVIDLTQTNRYYNKEELEANGVRHKKIWCPGGGKELPPRHIIQEFSRTVERFLSTEYDGLIGVHCTHGLNRTGYLICKFMVTHGMPAKDAIIAFENARGHKMERDLYVRDILGSGLAWRSTSPKEPARPATSAFKYRSPRDAPKTNFREKRPKTSPEAGGSRFKKLKSPEPAFEPKFKHKKHLPQATGSHSEKCGLPEHALQSKLKNIFLEKRSKETSEVGRSHSDKYRSSDPIPESKLKNNVLEKRLNETSKPGRSHSDNYKPSEPTPESKLKNNILEKRLNETSELGKFHFNQFRPLEPTPESKLENNILVKRLYEISEPGRSHSNKFRPSEPTPEPKLKNHWLEKRLIGTSEPGRSHSDKFKPAEPTANSKMKPSGKVERTSPLDDCYNDTRSNYSSRNIFYPQF